MRKVHSLAWLGNSLAHLTPAPIHCLIPQSKTGLSVNKLCLYCAIKMNLAERKLLLPSSVPDLQRGELREGRLYEEQGRRNQMQFGGPLLCILFFLFLCL